MQVLVSRAGLTLNPGQMADLVLAWRQMVGLLGLIPRDRPLIDDQAFVFRLPPPAAPAKPAPVKAAAAKPAPAKPTPAKRAAAKPAVASRARPSAPRAGKKAAPPAGKKAAARKTVRRRR